MVFNATFNNIGEGNGVPGENHRPAASHRQVTKSIIGSRKSTIELNFCATGHLKFEAIIVIPTFMPLLRGYFAKPRKIN
jgi:hypothetical protein